MNFPQFWARGVCGDFFCWRWSSSSLGEAQTLADQAAAQLAERFKHGDLPGQRHGYYPDRPFREQVPRELKNPAGELVALVTRNSYGCLVLNAARVMFIDVDLPEPKRNGGWFSRLFGKPDLTPPGDPQDAALAKAEAWSRNHTGWGWRVYRTRAGLRLLATHVLFEPEVAATDGVFDALGADPLYRQLCLNQKCFRARLTPKPWRCGVLRKAERWPWLNEKAEARFKKWEVGYQAKSSQWATCECIRKLGNSGVHPDVQLVLAVHDEVTRAESKLGLA
jgi:hypothetical protein